MVRDPGLTCSLSGLSEMSFKLEEVRFLCVMAGLPGSVRSKPVKASFAENGQRDSAYGVTGPVLGLHGGRLKT